MQHDEQVRLIKQMCAHLDGDTNVDAGGLQRNPTRTYTDPVQADREWNEWFRGLPQLIGLSGDLAVPGTFLTNNDHGTPILAIRDTNGDFKAFVNSCRHRGALVETAERGTKRRFTCPFHAWTYDSAGTLVGLPKSAHFGKVDKACMGLTELHVEERHGLLFVHPDPNEAVDLDWLLGDWFNHEFPTWEFDELELLTSEEYDTECNWKLAMDTFGETYHFTSLHPNTIALSFHGNVQCYDEEGHLHRMVLCKQSIDQMRLLPEDQWDITVAGLPVYWIFPNVLLMPFEIGVFLVRTIPTPGDPGRHVSKVDFYIRPKAVEANLGDMDVSDFNELAAEIARTFSAIIRDEDYVMSASQQTAADAGALDEIVFGRNEPALHHYHNTYRHLLGQEPLPLLDEISAGAAQ